jgi:hypothetical protein
MQPYRVLRKKMPHLFTNVCVCGQEKAYMDEVICDFHSRLTEAVVGPCIHQVDMFSGELTEHMEAVNYLRSQVKTVIGPKQTSKLQVTDITFAVMGKIASQACKSRQRRDQRRKAHQEGVSAKLDAGAFEVMEQTNAMHNACVKAADEGKVELSFRKAAWLAYEPGLKGLRKAEGARWSGLPLGGSNLPQSFLDRRFPDFDENGKPKRPDWSRLHQLRQKQIVKQQLDVAGKREGNLKAVKQTLQPDNAISKKWTTAELEGKELEEEYKDMNEKDASLGFLSEFLTQPDIEDDYAAAASKEDQISIELDDLQELEGMENSAWHRLPPKRRKSILDDARDLVTSSQAPKVLSAESKQEDKAHQFRN